MDFGRDTIFQFLLGYPPLLFAITVHEFAHAWVAYAKGDHTAALQGRMTLNPIPHMDLVGTLLIPLLQGLFPGAPLLGWAKPVPVNPYNFRNPRRDNILVSLAGPASNLILAVVFALIIRLLIFYPGLDAVFENPILDPFYAILQNGIGISLILAVFNLVPIYPLDGSHIIEGILPLPKAVAFNRLSPYGMIILLALLFTGLLNRIIFPPFMALLLGLKAVVGIP